MIKKMNKNIHTISFLVANKPGVLVRVALVFARRGFNIDSLVVSPSFNPRFSYMTITAQGDLETLEQIIKQSGKLVDVIHAEEHNIENAVEKEIALIKCRIKPQAKATFKTFLKKYKAVIEDISNDYNIIQATGTTEELDEFEVALKKKFGLLEVVRSGKLLMARGKEAT